MKQILFMFSLVLCVFLSSCTEEYPVYTGYEIATDYNKQDLLFIMPNPAISDYIVVSFRVSEPGLVKIYLSSITGKEIRVIENNFYRFGEYLIKLDIDDLPDGTYMIRMELPDGKNYWKYFYKGEFI